VDLAELGAAVVLPDPALVVLVGASAAGKSVWAAEHYRPDEVVSSDRLRALVGSGEHDLAASADAFALLDHIVAARRDSLGERGKVQGGRPAAQRLVAPDSALRIDPLIGVVAVYQHARAVDTDTG